MIDDILICIVLDDNVSTNILLFQFRDSEGFPRVTASLSKTSSVLVEKG